VGRETEGTRRQNVALAGHCLRDHRADSVAQGPHGKRFDRRRITMTVSRLFKNFPTVGKGNRELNGFSRAC
jgi:hypothetical protein